MTAETGAQERKQRSPASTNVFADLGIPEPEEALARARLAEAIDGTIQRRGLTQVQAAEIMGVDQPTVSRIVNDRLDGFSQERLLGYLVALGDDVEIVIRRPDCYRGEGRLRIRVL